MARSDSRAKILTRCVRDRLKIEKMVIDYAGTRVSRIAAGWFSSDDPLGGRASRAKACTGSH